MWVAFSANRHLYMESLTDLDKQLRLIQFLDYMVYEARVTPSLLDSSWASVKHYFFSQGPCASFLETPYISRAWKMSRRLIKKLNPQPLKLSIMPVNLEMATVSRTWSSSAGTLRGSLLDLTFRLGFYFGNRVSEIGSTQGSSHQLHSSHVRFHTTEGSAVRASDPVASSLKLDLVDCVSFYWPTSKTGCKTLFLTKQSPYSRELLRDILQWTKSIISGHEQLFLTYTHDSTESQVTRDDLNRYIKKLASHFNLNPSRFSTRSLRVGAASTLSAEGISKSSIDEAIGWSSRGATSLRYTRQSPRILETNPLAIRDLQVMEKSSTSSGQR
jgi:integrase